VRTPRMAHAVFPCDLASKSETGEHRVDMAPSTGNLQGNHRQMVRITIDTPPERASTFAQVIESEGLHVTSCTSMERRSGELSEVARIVYRVAGTAAPGLVGGTTFALANSAVERIRDRYPG